MVSACTAARWRRRNWEDRCPYTATDRAQAPRLPCNCHCDRTGRPMECRTKNLRSNEVMRVFQHGPSQAAGYHLQINGARDTANWVTLTNEPATVGLSNQIRLPAPATDAFYRPIL